MKRALSLILSIVLLLSLTACGAGDSGTTSTSASQTTVTTLDDVFDYIDQNTTVTEHPDGATTYTFTGSTVKPVIPTVINTTRARTTTTTKVGYTTVVITEKTKPTTTVKPAPLPTAPKTTTQKTVPGATTTTQKKFSYQYTSNQVHTAISINDRYYYSLMNAEMKAIYQKIDSAVRNLDASVSFDFNITENKKHRLYFLYMLDNPELFFLSNTVSLMSGSDGTSSITFSYSVGNKEGETCRYGSSMPEVTDALREKILQKKNKFDSAVMTLIGTIPANAPAVVKERMIYDKILLSSSYNLSAAHGAADAPFGTWDGFANDNWTSYGIMVNHTGVCESYAEAFQTLCNAVGIPCTRISNSSHAWSAVKLNGQWYQCDVTFDDPIGGDPNYAYHTYFNLTDTEMRTLGSRTWAVGPYTDDGYFKTMHFPVCTATQFNWKNFVAQYGE